MLLGVSTFATPPLNALAYVKINGITTLPSLSIKSTSWPFLSRLSWYTLTPEFDKDTLEYDIETDPSVTEVEVSAEAEDSEASVTINGYNHLAVGENDVTVTVLAADRKTYKNYIVHVFVGDISKMAYLNSISVSGSKFYELNPKLKKTTTSYVVTTESSDESVMIEETHDSSKNMVVTGTGEFDIFTVLNVFTLTATLYDTDKTTVINQTIYTINVVRPLSSNVYLTDLKVTSDKETKLLNSQGYYNLSKPFDRGTTEYALSVSPNVR